MATTLQQLITQCRQRTMMENDQSVLDTEITDMLNASLAMLDSFLKQNADYSITSTILTLSSTATPYIAVPSDFFKLRALEAQFPGMPNYYVTMSQFSMRQKNVWNNYTIFTPFDLNAGICNMQYRVMLPNIYIEPAWACTGTFRLWYTPVFTKLVNPSDTLAAYMDTNSWVEFTVCDVCAKIIEKQLMDSTPFVQRAMVARAQVEADSSVIDRGSVRTIADDRDGNNGGWGEGGGFW